jgi:hypothetical protein
MSKFTPEDATSRYRSTLQRMEAGKLAELGAGWGAAALAFYFKDDQTRAALSCRDTLLLMLQDDQRVLTNAILDEFLDSITLDQSATDVAGLIFDTYSDSKPRG